ncbi:MAG: DUF1559 domain-containing protein [Rhodopirellula sp.]|nr:DUF1559 domain-containing protein [Rhodopirellula sp.]
MHRNAITVMLACAAVLGAVTVFGAHGIWLGCVAVALTVFIASGPTPESRTLRAGGIALLLILVFCLLPCISAARSEARRSQCTNNLKQIGLALHNYHDAWGTFPPAYLADETGRPAHSWRVLLLPFVEQERLYEQYDFGEPWNGPKNSCLTLGNSSVYQCPARGQFPWADVPMTGYLAVVGPNTVWPGAEARKLDEFADRHHTILVVECFDREVPWSAPSDISVEEASVVPPVEMKFINWWLRLEPREPIPHHQLHQFTGRNALFAGGSVRQLPIDLSPSALRALTDIREVPKPDIESRPVALPLPESLKGLPVDPVAIRWAGFAFFLAALAGTGFSVSRGQARPEQPDSPKETAQ